MSKLTFIIIRLDIEVPTSLIKKMSENEPQDIKQDMSDMYDYFSDDKEFQNLIPEIDASMDEITPTAPIVDCLKTEETKVKRKRKYVECSICLQMKRSDRIKKHIKTH